MSKISLAPNAAGTAVFTIESPGTSTNRTLTLPDDTGTIVTNSGNQAGSFTTLNTSGAVVFNDAGADVDFRVESDTNENALFVEGSSGNVGIGTSTAQITAAGRGNITLNGSSSSIINLSVGDTNKAQIFHGGTDMFIGNQANGYLMFQTNATERARITSGGFFKASNTGSYRDANANNHELVNSIADIASFFLGNSSASPYGQQIAFTGASPNNTTNYFLAGDDSITRRVVIYSNGNIVNSNNSYGAISDIKLKQDIVDAGSQWDDIKGLRVRKYRWKSNPDGFMQIGLVAQEAEEVSPGLIDESPDFEEVEVPVLDDEGNAVLNEDGTPQVTKEQQATGEVTKSVKYSILYMKAVKALQEAMERIETLEAKVAALEANNGV